MYPETEFFFTTQFYDFGRATFLDAKFLQIWRICQNFLLKGVFYFSKYNVTFFLIIFNIILFSLRTKHFIELPGNLEV